MFCIIPLINYTTCTGCERCNCDNTGSVNASCDIGTGNCYCQPGVGGRRCDQCMQFYYGFSTTGCKGENLVEDLQQMNTNSKLEIVLDRMSK